MSKHPATVRLEAYEERLLEDTSISLDTAKRMLETYKKDGAPSVLYNVRTQAQQAAQWASELVGLLSAMREAAE